MTALGSTDFDLHCTLGRGAHFSPRTVGQPHGDEPGCTHTVHSGRTTSTFKTACEPPEGTGSRLLTTVDDKTVESGVK